MKVYITKLVTKMFIFSTKEIALEHLIDHFNLNQATNEELEKIAKQYIDEYEVIDQPLNFKKI